jgi:RHS repeat-associated protein
VFATNAAGTKVWTASYLPFGGVRTTTGTPITARFPGQWFQSESGLHQNWMRDYDPTTGRYLQADPLGLVAGASVYGYANQSPMMYIDTTGQCPWCAGAIIGGIIGGIAAYNNAPCAANVIAGIIAGATAGALGSFLQPGYAAFVGASSAGAGQLAGNAAAEITGADCKCRFDNLWWTPGFWANVALGGLGGGTGPRIGESAASWLWGGRLQFGGRAVGFERTATAIEGTYDALLEGLGNLAPNAKNKCGCEKWNGEAHVNSSYRCCHIIAHLRSMSALPFLLAP